jgi:cohesin loading factor subunit SCC2
LCRYIPVRRLLGALEDSAITVRAAAVRAIGGVVDADPKVLGWDQVQSAVERRMTDNGTMVGAVQVETMRPIAWKHLPGFNP